MECAALPLLRLRIPVEKNGLLESAPTPGGAPSRWFDAATGIVLAVVAAAIAWSGYQAARWGGVQAQHTELQQRHRPAY